MTDKKISQLDTLSDASLTDTLPIVTSGSLPLTKKVTVQEILTTTTPSLTSSGTIAGAKLSASGSATIGTDLSVGSGVSVGSATDSAGDGELWLAESYASNFR